MYTLYVVNGDFSYTIDGMIWAPLQSYMDFVSVSGMFYT